MSARVLLTIASCFAALALLAPAPAQALEDIPNDVPAQAPPIDEPIPDLPVVEATTDPILDLLLQAANPRLPEKEGQRFFNELVARGGTAMPSLAKVFRDPKSTDRANWVAARAIGRIGGEGARRSLETGLGSPRVITRLGAVDGLQMIGDKAAVEPLERALLDQAMTVRAAAADALGAIGARRSAKALSQALDLPANFHQGRSLFVRRHIIEALGAVGSISGIDALVGALSDRDGAISMAALRALTQVTGMEFRGNSVLPGTPVGEADIEAWTTWWSKRRAGSSTEAGSR